MTTGVKTYSIGYTHGRTDKDRYASLEAASREVRRAMGWDEVVLSDSYADTDGNGYETTAWSAYESQERCDADSDGARAPRITAIDRARELAAEVRALDPRLDDGTGDLGVIVRQALKDDVDATAEEVVAIIREALADAERERA